MLPGTGPSYCDRRCTVNQCWSNPLSQGVEKEERRSVTAAGQVERAAGPEFGGPISCAAIVLYTDRAVLWTHVQGDPCELGALASCRLHPWAGVDTTNERTHSRHANQIAWGGVGATQKADLAELADWVEGLRAAAQTARVQGNTTLADALDITRFEVYESYLDEELDHQQSQAAARRSR